MKPEAQQIEIAKACGWKLEMVRADANLGKSSWILTRPDGGLVGERSWIGLQKNLPDYLNDLNAMISAEETAIEPHFTEQYAEQLYMVLERFWTPDRWVKFSRFGIDYAFTHASATQRAEAFLKTLGLWKDE